MTTTLKLIDGKSATDNGTLGDVLMNLRIHLEDGQTFTLEEFYDQLKERTNQESLINELYGLVDSLLAAYFNNDMDLLDELAYQVDTRLDELVATGKL